MNTCIRSGVGILTLGSASFAAGSAVVFDLVSSFEGEATTTVTASSSTLTYTMRPSVEVYGDPSGVVHGDRAARITSAAQFAGHPGLAVRRNPTSLNYDFRGAAGLAADFTNRTAHQVYIGVKLTDAKNAIYEGQVAVPARSRLRAALSLNQHFNPQAFGLYALPDSHWSDIENGRIAFFGRGPAAFDLGSVKRIDIFASRPRVAVDLSVDYLRLIHSPYNPYGQHGAIENILDGFVDAYGQPAGIDYPAKFVPNELNGLPQRTNLHARYNFENLSLGPFTRPNNITDYMGFAGLQVGTPGNYFRTVRYQKRSYFLDPTGAPFVSIGVNTLEPHSNDTVVAGSAGDTIYERGGVLGYPRASLMQPHLNDPDAYATTTLSSGVTWPIYSHYIQNLKLKYRASNFPTQPNYWREEWSRQSARRLVNWGFNTIGMFSGYHGRAPGGSYTGINAAVEGYQPGDGAKFRIPYTIGFRLTAPSYVPMSNGKRIGDPWHPQFRSHVRSIYQATYSRHPELKTDPYLLGIFLDNEPPFLHNWNGYTVLPLSVMALDANDSHAKVGMIEWLQLRYRTEGVSGMNRTWGTQFQSWEDVRRPFTITKISNKADEDLHNLLVIYGERYIAQLNSAIRGIDANHLLLGLRLDRWTVKMLQKMDKYTHVHTFNVYEPDLNSPMWKELTQFKRPGMVSEFHFSAPDQGHSLNFLQPVADQAARAEAYDKFVDSVLQHSHFIGCHWHQFADTPLSGHDYYGENFNVGLVDITDTPYTALINAARTANARKYARFGG
jgi:agarase